MLTLRKKLLFKNKRGQSMTELILLLPFLIIFLYFLLTIIQQNESEKQLDINQRTETFTLAKDAKGNRTTLEGLATIELPQWHPDLYLTEPGKTHYDWGNLFKGLAFNILSSIGLQGLGFDASSWYQNFLFQAGTTYVFTGDPEAALIAGGAAAVSSQDVGEKLAESFGGAEKGITTASAVVTTTQGAATGLVSSIGGSSQDMLRGTASGALSGYLASSEFSNWVKSTSGDNKFYQGALVGSIHSAGESIIAGNFDLSAVVATGLSSGTSLYLNDRFDNMMLSQSTNAATNAIIHGVLNGNLNSDDVINQTIVGFASGAISETMQSINNRIAEKRAARLAEEAATSGIPTTSSAENSTQPNANSKASDIAAAAAGNEPTSSEKVAETAVNLGRGLYSSPFESILMPALSSSLYSGLMGGMAGPTVTIGDPQQILIQKDNSQQIFAALDRMRQQRLEYAAAVSAEADRLRAEGAKQMAFYQKNLNLGGALKTYLESNLVASLSEASYQQNVQQRSGVGRATTPEIQYRSEKLAESEQQTTERTTDSQTTTNESYLVDTKAYDQAVKFAKEVVASPQVQQPLEEFVEEAVNGGIQLAMAKLIENRKQQTILQLKQQYWARRRAEQVS